MKYIRRTGKVKNDDTKGYIINSTNVEDKEKNTYSANVIDGLIEKNILNVALKSGNKFIKTKDDDEIIPFNEITVQLGNKLTLENGKIVVGKGIKKVKLWGGVAISNDSTATRINMKMQRKRINNEVAVFGENIRWNPVAWETISSTPRFAYAQEGDEFYVTVNSKTGDIVEANQNTFLIVEAIE